MSLPSCGNSCPMKLVSREWSIVYQRGSVLLVQDSGHQLTGHARNPANGVSLSPPQAIENLNSNPQNFLALFNPTLEQCLHLLEPSAWVGDHYRGRRLMPLARDCGVIEADHKCVDSMRDTRQGIAAKTAQRDIDAAVDLFKVNQR
jgi:hypothetical protein